MSRLEFRLVGQLDAEEDDVGLWCTKGDCLNNGVCGADSRRAFLAAIDGDAVTANGGGRGESERFRDEGDTAVTEVAFAGPCARGLALFG